MIVPIAESCHFTINNIPFGVFSCKGIEKNHLSSDHHDKKIIGTAIGEYAVDLKSLVLNDFIIVDSVDKSELVAVLSEDNLNDFMALGRSVWKSMRLALINFFENTSDFQRYEQCFFKLDSVQMHLPIKIGDYTDFYASKEHASNVGEIFRGKDNALMPNWLHLPVGYHGRASSIVVSGTPVKRPSGQSKPPEGAPVFGPSKKLDFELEMVN